MKDLKQTSKYLSLLLRHQPELLQLTMDSEGWVSVDQLLTRMNEAGHKINQDTLDIIVATSDKKRFAFSEDSTSIRASQGHSIDVDLQYAQHEPAGYLYHGTVEKYLDSIRTEGLRRMSRTHVHLSRDLATATTVGSRRGNPVILTIRAEEMHRDGYKFYLSANQVWLTAEVPARYIDFPIL